MYWLVAKAPEKFVNVALSTVASRPYQSVTQMENDEFELLTAFHFHVNRKHFENVAF